MRYILSFIHTMRNYLSILRLNFNRLTRTSLSSRGDLVAAGFSDSTIKLWDLSQEKSQWNDMTQLYIDTDGTRHLRVN